MLRNLKEVHRQTHDAERLLRVAERMVVLLPTAWEERRDRGLAHAALGHAESAAADLGAYLDQRPQAEDAPAIRLRLDELRRCARPRLH